MEESEEWEKKNDQGRVVDETEFDIESRERKKNGTEDFGTVDAKGRNYAL